jgi:hypothetical protein
MVFLHPRYAAFGTPGDPSPADVYRGVAVAHSGIALGRFNVTTINCYNAAKCTSLARSDPERDRFNPVTTPVVCGQVSGTAKVPQSIGLLGFIG